MREGEAKCNDDVEMFESLFEFTGITRRIFH